jgi:PAS domain S-box-containing protein
VNPQNPTYKELAARLADAQARLAAQEQARQGEPSILGGPHVRRLLEHMADALFLHDMTGRILDVNRRACESLGYTREALLNRHVWDITTTPPEMVAQVWQRLEQEAPLTQQGVHRRQDGSRFPVELRMDLLEAEGQKLIVVLARDITRRLEAEQALRQSEARYRTLVENLSIAICRLTPGPKGKFLMANPAYLELVGVASEEALQEFSVADFYIDPDYRKVIADRLVAEGQVKGLELQLQKADGTPFWVSVTAHVTYDQETGEPLYFDSTLEDITERKRAQVALQRSEQRFRRLVQHASDAIFLRDMQGHILDANLQAAKNLGYTHAELLDLTVSDLEASRSPEEVLALSQRLLDEAPITFETWHRRKDGTVFPVEVRLDLLEADGSPMILAVARDITARRQAERALRESERQYRTLVENLPIGICRNTPGPEGEYLMANPTYLEIFGVPSEEALKNYHPVDFYVDPQERKAFSDRLLAEGHLSGFELEQQKVDGTPIWISVTSRVTYDEETGEVAYFDNSVEDITERKRAEQSLQQYAERLRVLRAIDSAILAAWSPEEIARSALRRIRQLVPCEVSGIVMFDLPAQEIILLALQLDTERTVDLPPRFPLQGGLEFEALRRGEILVEEDAAAVVDPAPGIQALKAAGYNSFVALPLIARGELIGALGLIGEGAGIFSTEHIDISREMADQLAVALHQARLRDALEAERQRLETLVRHLPEGILLLDHEHRIRLANPIAESLLPLLSEATAGEVLAELAGQPLIELLRAPPDGIPHEIQIADTPQEQSLWSHRSQRVFEVIGQPIAASSGATGWVLVIREVTQERDMQERLQQQDRLAAVGQLAAGIAHDFNNIMASIVLYTGMLLRTMEVSGRNRERLDIIRQQSHRAADLVQQILDFSRQSVMERRPLDLVPFMKELVKLLERILPENIEIVFEWGEQEYAVEGDPTRLQQVVMNLAVNARDAMSSGGELSFRLSRYKVQSGESRPLPDLPPGHWVCLTVYDTGSGIDPEVLPHIFEPFYTTKGPGGGTGLGLAQVYGIVKQHDGYVDVESQLGEGAVFRLYFPALELARAVTLAARDETWLRGRGETVLVVEDDATAREAILETLEMLGYRVLAAQDGEQAVTLFAQHADEIALVLSDLVMPKLGGAALYERLREEHPAVKMIVMTGYPLENGGRRLLERGVMAWIPKPLSANVLARTIREVLGAPDMHGD